MTPIILRLPAVISACGLSRSTIYSHIQQGIWTKPVALVPALSDGLQVRLKRLFQLAYLENLMLR